MTKNDIASKFKVTVHRAGLINLSEQSVQRFGVASTIFSRKHWGPFLVVVVVVLIHFNYFTLPQQSLAQWLSDSFHVCLVVGPPMWSGLMYTCTLCTLDNLALIIRILFVFGWIIVLIIRIRPNSKAPLFGTALPKWFFSFCYVSVENEWTVCGYRGCIYYLRLCGRIVLEKW